MIDWERIEDLRRELGHKDFADVVALFFEEIDSSLPGSLDLTEPNEIRDLLHFIRGSGLNLGFFELARLCEPDFLRWKRAYLSKKFGPISNDCGALMKGPRRSIFRISHCRFKFKLQIEPAFHHLLCQNMYSRRPRGWQKKLQNHRCFWFPIRSRLIQSFAQIFLNIQNV